MKRLAGLAAASLALGCHGMKLDKVMNASPADLAAVKDVAKDQGAANRMQKQCDVIAKREPDIQEETALGGAVALNWIQGSGGLLLDKRAGTAALNRYLNAVGKNLAAQSARPTLSWTFGVLKADAFNALSAPAGYVFVAKGLLEQVENEAQLAGVLGHEIAHVTERHALETYRRLLVEPCESEVLARRGRTLSKEVGGAVLELAPEELQTVLSLGQSAGQALDLDDNWKLLGKLTEGTVKRLRESGFSKDDEFESDRIAVELMLSAGYDPDEYVRFLGKIPEKNGLFTAHPGNASRQKKLREWLDDAKAKEGEFSTLPASRAALVKVPLKAELAIVK